MYSHVRRTEGRARSFGPIVHPGQWSTWFRTGISAKLHFTSLLALCPTPTDFIYALQGTTCAFSGDPHAVEKFCHVLVMFDRLPSRRLTFMTAESANFVDSHISVR
jgi:hypothetical protein